MSRKVCKRKHYELVNPLDYVLNGMLPVKITSPIMTARTKNHWALKAVMSGTAVFNDFDTLVAAFNMGEALADRGVGSEYLADLMLANVAVSCIQLRGGPTGPEIAALQLGLEIHDAQLDDSRTTVQLIGEALAAVRRNIRIKKQQRAVAQKVKNAV